MSDLNTNVSSAYDTTFIAQSMASHILAQIKIDKEVMKRIKVLERKEKALKKRNWKSRIAKRRR